MIRPSPELLAVTRRWFKAMPDNEKALRNLLSDHKHLRFVGTGEDEVWAGRAVRDGIGEFFGAVPNFISSRETFAEAYENGDTGWSCTTHETVFADQPERPYVFRTTLIFALEDGAWKIVQRHASVPIPNMDLMGTEQTAIADLVAAAQEDFSLDQREGFASVMFTDLVNSSRLASIMGDRLWSSEITRHFAALRRIIEARGGQFVKSLGDGTMSSFPNPTQALAAARDIMASTRDSDGPALALRIGIHTGSVVQTDDDFFGTVVNKAARVGASAAPGQICLSAETHDLVPSETEFRFIGAVSVRLKGLEGEHVIYRLEWEK